jgi:hypothetical protein
MGGGWELFFSWYICMWLCNDSRLRLRISRNRINRLLPTDLHCRCEGMFTFQKWRYTFSSYCWTENCQGHILWAPKGLVDAQADFTVGSDHSQERKHEVYMAVRVSGPTYYHHLLIVVVWKKLSRLFILSPFHVLLFFWSTTIFCSTKQTESLAISAFPAATCRRDSPRLCTLDWALF